jgi:hypothetical protein
VADDTILGAGLSHHYALFVSYAIAMLAWGRIARRSGSLWATPATFGFARPRREMGVFAAALLLVLAIGQLFARDLLLPARGVPDPVVDAANQLLIFAPIIALPFVRRRALFTEAGPADARSVFASMWLPLDRVWARLLTGGALSLVAVLVFTSVRSGSDAFVQVVARVYSPSNLGHWTQVFCEDIAIAVLFVRVRTLLGLWRTIAGAAVLFAAAHVPALVAGGASPGELAGLALDAALGVMVLYFVQRSADVWWFVWVHFALDMMQFHAVPGGFPAGS